VGGQTSVKHPEIHAFRQHLPADVHIVSCHSMHGPAIDPRGQPLVICGERCDDSSFQVARRVLNCLQSTIVSLSAAEHDRITADTQAVTHLAFLSMGSAWKSQQMFPWQDSTYIGGIENIKVMTALRIYASKWHVYAGLAIMNPSARRQIQQYAQSVSELFKLMITEASEEFTRRIRAAAQFVFGDNQQQPILLSDSWLDQYSLSSVPPSARKPNSHLSLLAIVDCWHRLGINPYAHMICQTPPFRMWLGITEYLFRSSDMLESAIQAALFDKSIRADDLEFVNATQAWSQTILLGSMDGYRQRFEETAAFFDDRLRDARQLSNAIIERLSKKICNNNKSS
jgi:prephenate dehydrogenase (NADP+)